MSTAHVMQSGVLVHAVARVPKAFMVQAAAVGPSAENRVADGSCGSRQSFDRGFSGSSVEVVGSLEESWMVFLQQSNFWQSVVWQLAFVRAVGPTAEDCVAALISGVLIHAVVIMLEAFMMGSVISLMQRLHDLGSLTNTDANADADADVYADTNADC